MAKCSLNKGYSYWNKQNLKITGVRNGTKTRKILEYLDKYGPTSKYELLTKVLGKTGSRKELRGYWSDNFLKMRNGGIIELDKTNKEYYITDLGRERLNNN